MESKHDIEAPKSAAKAIHFDYNQTYFILDYDESMLSPMQINNNIREVLFRCGNWCYSGKAQFSNCQISMSAVQTVVQTLQSQQSQLRYSGEYSKLSSESVYFKPSELLFSATEAFAKEVTSAKVMHELEAISTKFSWIENEELSTYFELTLHEIPDYMRGVSMIASKTYTKGLIVITIYCNGVFYFIIDDGEGEQQLLDLSFPNISQQGHGYLVSGFSGQLYHNVIWNKLTLWKLVPIEYLSEDQETNKTTVSVSVTDYQQTYCIMKPNSGISTKHYDVLFRFGSWIYCGNVELVENIQITDIPFVIPVLRSQQSTLKYFCDVNSVPLTSPFALTLDYIHKYFPVIENQIKKAEVTLEKLLDRLKNIGLDESVGNWIDGDPNHSFFEFTMEPDLEYQRAFAGMELAVSKSYRAGLIVIVIFFQNSVYLSLQNPDDVELKGKGNSLLDVVFPDVSGKGRGYRIEAYENGIDEWKCLRKISIWQTIKSMEEEYQMKLMLNNQNNEINDNNEIHNNNDNIDVLTDSDAKIDSTSKVKADSKIVRSKDMKEMAQININRNSDSSHLINTQVLANEKDASSNDVKYIDDTSQSTLNVSNRFVSIQSSTASNLLATNYKPHHLPKLQHTLAKLEKTQKYLEQNNPYDDDGKPRKLI